MTGAGSRAAGVPLRPLGTAELLDGAVRLVRRNAAAVFTLSVPFALARAALDAGVDLTGGSLGTQLGVVVGLLITGSLGTVLTGLLTPVLAGDVLGERMGAGQAVRRVGRRWWPLVVVALVATVAQDVGLVLLAVGGVWLWGMWAVAAPALVAEDLGVRDALKRSFQLVRTLFWRVWGLRALGWVLTTVLGLLIQLPFLVLAGAVGDTNPLSADAGFGAGGLFVTLTAAGTLLAAALTAPITSAVDVLLYVDLRMRREGMDLVLALPAPVTAPLTAW